MFILCLHVLLVNICIKDSQKWELQPRGVCMFLLGELKQFFKYKKYWPIVLHLFKMTSTVIVFQLYRVIIDIR